MSKHGFKPLPKERCRGFLTLRRPPSGPVFYSCNVRKTVRLTGHWMVLDTFRQFYGIRFSCTEQGVHIPPWGAPGHRLTRLSGSFLVACQPAQTPYFYHHYMMKLLPLTARAHPHSKTNNLLNDRHFLLLFLSLSYTIGTTVIFFFRVYYRGATNRGEWLMQEFSPNSTR